jgi:hypothetical protein
MCDNGDFFDDWGWEDIAMAGFLAEEIAEAELERILIEKEMEDDETDDDF